MRYHRYIDRYFTVSAVTLGDSFSFVITPARTLPSHLPGTRKRPRHYLPFGDRAEGSVVPAWYLTFGALADTRQKLTSLTVPPFKKSEPLPILFFSPSTHYTRSKIPTYTGFTPISLV